jgi:hypothetical protein
VDAHHGEQRQVTGPASKSYGRIDEGYAEKANNQDKKLTIDQGVKVMLT